VAVGVGIWFLASPRAGQAACDTAQFSAPPRRDFAVGWRPYLVAVGDFNGDGTPDVAVADNFSNTVSILLGTGTGSFGAASSFTVGTSPQSVAVGDFNGDGSADLAAANGGSNTVSILLNACVPLAQAAPCRSNDDCAGGLCVDGVCCDSACGGGLATDCEACSAASGAAVDGTCGPVAAGFICRAGSGSSLTCPADAVALSGALCRAAAGDCDLAETCNGTTKLCPSDAKQPDGTPCSDGNLCTTGDTCGGGWCQSGPVEPVPGCSTAITPDPRIQGMLDQVMITTVTSYEAQLTGEQPVALSDGPYTITRRETDSGMPIQKALQSPCATTARPSTPVIRMCAPIGR